MCLILACIAIGIFAVYNACVIGKFGVPSSLSVSYYLWNGLRSHLGYIFTGMMFAVSMLLMPAWLDMSEGSPFQFLAFFYRRRILIPAFLLQPRG